MYFWNKFLHVSDSSSIYHEEFFTLHAAVCICHTAYADSLLASCQQNLYDIRSIPLLCVQRKNPDDGQRNCPKYVDFYFQNKFEKLVYLVGFIIRITHDIFLFTLISILSISVYEHLHTNIL